MVLARSNRALVAPDALVDGEGRVCVRDSVVTGRGGAGRRGDGRARGPIGKLGEKARHLIAVERLRAPAEVNRAESSDDLGWHPPDECVQIGEAAQRTAQPNPLNMLIVAPLSMFSRFTW